MESANADQHRSQAPEDHRCRTGIRHCQVRMCLHWCLSMICQMRTLHFHLLLGYVGFFLHYEVIPRALYLTPQEISTQHPHLQLTKKRRRRGLSCLKMADSRAPSMVFWYLQPTLVCRRPSYECWELYSWSRKGSHASKWRYTGKEHEIPCHARLRFDGILATVCSCTRIRQFWLSSLAKEKTLERLAWIFDKWHRQMLGTTCPKHNRFGQ